MKNLKLVLFVFLTGFFACTQKEVAPETFETEVVTTENFNIVGRWSLIESSGMFKGGNYQIGEVILEFKSNDTLIVKTNTSLLENELQFRTNTAYQFKNNVLSIEGTTYYCGIRDGHFILDAGSSYDGPRHELVKLK